MDEPDWEQDELQYGYSVYRPPTGGSWHLHIGITNLKYDCHLLGRRTDILAVVQFFESGAIRRSPSFYLTLDGEGVEIAFGELIWDSNWGSQASALGSSAPLPFERPSADAKAEAVHIQREIIPLLYASDSMQAAVAEIVHRQRHLHIASRERFMPSGEENV
ncbi:hypothetical protein NA78x_001277 [Anatilimnocola sp. NA78]|uniref:hypothetical protein n=1 Tax=Anatilimnocola sp. NA78 TaxID=3415683 RepID=UPI003CE56279